MITVDTIIESVKQRVESGVPIAPSEWLDIAQRLNAVLGDESDRLAELQWEVANLKARLMEDGATAARAKIFAEASPEFKLSQKLRAHIEQAQEHIRIAKHQARMKADEMRSYG